MAYDNPKLLTKQQAAIRKVFDDFAAAYAAVYSGRRPDYYSYSESNDMMLIYVGANIKVESGSLTRIKQRTKQLVEKARNER